jgi:tetratricopeptide (TPR) repeat protein
MILALFLAAAPVPSATPLTAPPFTAPPFTAPPFTAPPFTASAAEAQAAAQKSRILWGIGGNLRLKAGDATTAAKDFDQGLAIPGGSPLERGELLLDRARAAQASGDLAAAGARSAEAARLVPADPFLWYFRATLAVAASDVPSAKIAIARALALAPNDPTILFESGHVASLAGEDAAARTAWAKALAADPNGPTGQRAREALGLAGVPLTVK